MFRMKTKGVSLSPNFCRGAEWSSEMVLEVGAHRSVIEVSGPRLLQEPGDCVNIRPCILPAVLG
jgi:hypothetical protein